MEAEAVLGLAERVAYFGEHPFSREEWARWRLTDGDDLAVILVVRIDEADEIHGIAENGLHRCLGVPCR